MDKISFSIIIPCYNEHDEVGAMIDSVIRESKIRTLESGYIYEIIVVDDGSTDGSPRVIEQKAEEYKCVASILLPKNCGKGCAIRHGLMYAQGEIILFIDGDNEIGAHNIHKFLGSFSDKEKIDVVIGSKFCDGGSRHTSLKRHIFSMVYRLMNRILFGLSIEDTQMGIKAMRRDVRIRLLPYLHVNGYAFDIEFLIHAARHDYVIREIPVDVHINPTDSRITHLSIVEMLRDTFSVYHCFFQRDLRNILNRNRVRVRVASLRHFAVLPLACLGSATSRLMIIIISIIIVCATLTTKNRASSIDNYSNQK